MSYSVDATWREVTSQIVHDPRYKKLATVPIVAVEQVAVILAAYTVFGLSTLGFLYGYLWWPVAALISGVAIYASFTPLHDATHRSLSRNRIVNDLLGTISGQLIFPGVTASVYRTLHLTHHRFAGDKQRDPDEAFTARRGVSLWLTLAFIEIHWLQWYFAGGKAHLPKRFFWEMAAFLAANVIITVGFLASPYWFEFIILFMIPHRIGTTLVAYLFAHIQHPDEVTFEDQPFQTTAYIPANWVERFFMLGQADHHIHHLLPNLPHYRYRPVWDFANNLLGRQDIPRGSFLGAPKLGPAAAAAAAPRTMTVLVTAVEDVGEGVRHYTLADPAGDPLPRHEAGAHIALHLPSGAIRHYSLCGDPADVEAYRIAVKRDDAGRGGSKEVHSVLEIGSTLTIGAPRNNFLLYEEGARFKLVAGGVGATPLLAMGHRLKALGKPFELHLCARDAASVPFGETLGELPFHDEIAVHLDGPDGRSSFDPEARLGRYQEGDRLYLCGPAGFMTWLREAAAELGWPDEAVLYESFSAPIADAGATEAFKVTLARSGKTIEVGADQAIIDVLPDLGVPVETSCMQGVCGTCVTAVLDGEVDHRDATLTEAERASNAVMCVCISRAKKGQDLVLDL
ncbi:MAG: fatty acid desaturase [Pseudomonadota bacterium]